MDAETCSGSPKRFRVTDCSPRHGGGYGVGMSSTPAAAVPRSTRQIWRQAPLEGNNDPAGKSDHAEHGIGQQINAKVTGTPWRTPNVMHAGATRHWQDMEDLSPDSRQLFEDIEEAQREEVQVPNDDAKARDNEINFVSRVFPPSTSRQDRRRRIVSQDDRRRRRASLERRLRTSRHENAAAANNAAFTDDDASAYFNPGESRRNRYYREQSSSRDEESPSLHHAGSVAAAANDICGTPDVTASCCDRTPPKANVPIVKRTLHYMSAHSRATPQRRQQHVSGGGGGGGRQVPFPSASSRGVRQVAVTGIWDGDIRGNHESDEDDDEDDEEEEEGGDHPVDLTTPCSAHDSSNTSFESSEYDTYAQQQQLSTGESLSRGVRMRSARMSCASSSTPSDAIDLTMSPMRLRPSSTRRPPSGQSDRSMNSMRAQLSTNMTNGSHDRQPRTRGGGGGVRTAARSRRNLGFSLDSMTTPSAAGATAAAAAAAAAADGEGSAMASTPQRRPFALDTAIRQHQQQHTGATPRMGQCSIRGNANATPLSVASEFSSEGESMAHRHRTPASTFLGSNLQFTPEDNNNNAPSSSVSASPPLVARNQGTLYSEQHINVSEFEGHEQVDLVSPAQVGIAVSHEDAFGDSSSEQVHQEQVGDNGGAVASGGGDDLMDESERLCRQLMMEEQAALMERIHQEQQLVIQQMNAQASANDHNNNEGEANDLNVALELATQQEHEGDDAAGGAGGAGELDPDTMSYDQLLELGDRIGDVGQEKWRVEGKEAVQALPVVSFSSDKAVFNAALQAHMAETGHVNTELTVDFVLDDPKCLICQYAYESEDKLKLLPCSHGFHEECIDGWLKDYKTCVLCRQSIVQQ